MEREGCSACSCLKIPGVCFDPCDEELIAYYLQEKIHGRPLQCNHLMTELKIYDDDLMPREVLKDDNPYWMASSSPDSSSDKLIKKTIYVFTELRKKKSRVIRRSGRGSWTGQNNPVVKDKAGNDIGYNKLLTFYEGTDDKKGKKKINNDHGHGHWIMHEYSLFGMDKYVLCKIVKEVRINAKASGPTKAAAATQDFCTQGADAGVAETMNVALDDERQLGGAGDQILDWDTNGWMEELYKQLGQDDIQVPNFLIEEEAINDVTNQPSDESGISDYTNAGAGVVEVLGNPQQGKDILDVSLTDIAWDGLDVVLDFSSPELFALWPDDEAKEQSCSIFGSQPEKRMRYGEEDKEEESPTGKKQSCI